MIVKGRWRGGFAPATRRPGESVQIEDGKEPLVVLRRKKRTLTAEDIHTELDRICKGAPEMDTLAVLNDLRE